MEKLTVENFSKETLQKGPSGHSNKRLAIAVLATALATGAAVKAVSVYDRLEDVPQEAAEARKEALLKQFEDWKVETKQVADEVLQEEKAKLKSLAVVMATPAVTLSYKDGIKFGFKSGDFKARKDVLTALYEDMNKVYSGEKIDFNERKMAYGLMILTMEDERLKTAIIDCLGPMQRLDGQLSKLDDMTDIKTQVDAYKVEVKQRSIDELKKEIPFLG